MVRYYHRATCFLAATLVAVLVAVSAVAQTATISDGNSTAHFDLTAAGVGMDAWTVNGVNQLAEHSFWYRVGASGAAQRINLLTLSGYSASVNRLDATYVGPTFRIDLDWTLFGASPGFGQSDIGELIRITNTSQTALDFHFWQYADLNLLGTPLDTSVSITGGNTAWQYDGATVAEAADVPTPSRYEAGFNSTVLAHLSAGNLNNNASQTNGNLAWAFQWDRVLTPGASLIISKDNNLDVVVPEPGTLALLGIGVTGLLAGAWRRRRT
jgi:hypothetical protein